MFSEQTHLRESQSLNQAYFTSMYFYPPFFPNCLYSRFGTHAMVCCPSYSSDAIFFPSDPSSPEYEAGSGYVDDYDYGPSYDVDVQVPDIPKVSFN